MKTIILILFISINLFAQQFKVESVKGTVKVLHGTEESFRPVKVGEYLNGDDLLLTEENSFVRLRNEESNFALNSNAALGLDRIKKISINDLLLTLAMEEIKSVPKREGKSEGRNTAVYGTEISDKALTETTDEIGEKMLNGAKQLAENGFEESAIIAAKETYEKHPLTKKIIKKRLYFAGLLENLGLSEEALDEYNDIKKYASDKEDISLIDKKIEEIVLKK
ncbi:MAG: hypothetical protein GXO87_12575 [Chlorobi bacterium]|nr:hypothetical protein [Chlorobiota bacterium]